MKGITGTRGVHYLYREGGHLNSFRSSPGTAALLPLGDDQQLGSQGQQFAGRDLRVPASGVPSRKRLGNHQPIHQRQQLVQPRAGMVAIITNNASGFSHPARGLECGRHKLAIQVQYTRCLDGGAIGPIQAQVAGGHPPLAEYGPAAGRVHQDKAQVGAHLALDTQPGHVHTLIQELVPQPEALGVVAQQANIPGAGAQARQSHQGRPHRSSSIGSQVIKVRTNQPVEYGLLWRQSQDIIRTVAQPNHIELKMRPPWH